MKIKGYISKIVFFLFLLNVNSIYGQKLIVNNFKEIPTDISAREHKILDVNDEACSLIKIYTGLKGLKIDGNRGVEKVEQHSGVLWVWVSHGTRQLKIAKENMPMLPFYVPFALQESTVYSMELTTDEVFSIVVNTHEVDASVTLKGENYKSNESIKNLPAGNYMISISAYGYNTINDTIRVDKDHTLFNFTLEKAKQAVMTITTTPTNCLISIDKAVVGNSSFSNYYYPGEYHLQITTTDYLSIDTIINFDPLKKQDKFHFNLTRSVGWLKVNSSPVATIVIDGKNITSDIVKLNANTRHELRVTKPLYNDYTETFNITRSDTVVKNIKLVKIKGKLSLIIKPDSSAVKIIDFNDVETNWIGNAIKDLPIGKYELEARKKGFKKLDTSFVILKDKNNHLTLGLKPRKFSRLGAGVLSMIIPGTGQYYAQRNTTGTLFLISTVSLGAVTGVLYMQSEKQSKKYLDAQSSYRNETDPYLIDSKRLAMDREYDKYTKINDQKNLFLYITAGVYALNVLDAIVFAKYHLPKLDNKITDNLHVNFITDPKLSVTGFNISYRF